MRKPLPPNVLASALQDRIAPASGRLQQALPLLAYTCKISQESLHRLQAIKRKTGASVSEQIRRGVEMWLKQQEHQR